MIKRTIIALLIFSMSKISAQKTTEFYKNGQKSYEGEFAYIYEDDIFSNQEKNNDDYLGYRKTIIKHVKNGSFTSWYKNGNKKEIGIYTVDVPNGKFEFYFENGNKMAEGEFNYGFRFGNWITYYENGVKKMEGNYDKYSNSQLDSISTNLDVFKEKKNDYTYYDESNYNEKTKLEHPQKWKDSDVENIENRLDGNYSKKNGKFTFYRENGNVEYECFYYNNLKQGKWLFYFTNSKLSKELLFESDSCKGKSIEYYDTGMKLYEGTVKGGIEVVENVWNDKGVQLIKNGTGEHIRYHDNGKVLVKTYYKNGFRDKIWYWYRSDGSLELEEVYKEGRVQSRTFYDNKEKIFQEEIYTNDELSIRRTYTDGQLTDEYKK